MAKGIAHFGILFSLTIYSGHVNAILVSDLLISEVMANPAALPDARGEWFELYNPTDREINLRDFTIGDDGRDIHKFESDLLILPGEYLTLARSDDPGFTPTYVYDNFTLGNGADEIVFSDGLTELLRLDYGSDFDQPGQSRELTALPMFSSNYALTPELFSYGDGDIGTPGSAGSVSLAASVAPPPVTANLAISAVPVPATVWLFISGLLTLIVAPILSRCTPATPRSQTVIPDFKIAIPGTKIVIPRLDPMRRTGGTQ